MTPLSSQAGDNPLEDLLTHALIQVAPKKGKGSRRPTISDFKDHEQWFRTRCIALWHVESNTLLGNYAEYRHPKDSTARWLQREEGLAQVNALESVSGPQWVEWANPEAERLHRLEKEVDIVLDLTLPAFNVRAPAVLVHVILSGIGIHRVELSDTTVFYSGDSRVALTLPKRLNILEELSRDCKLALKEEVEA